jgi:hypothetical protein
LRICRYFKHAHTNIRIIISSIIHPPAFQLGMIYQSDDNIITTLTEAVLYICLLGTS